MDAQTNPSGSLSAEPEGPLSLRTISRELGISRATGCKYTYAEKLPTKKLGSRERVKLMALRNSTTVAN